MREGRGGRGGKREAVVGRTAMGAEREKVELDVGGLWEPLLGPFSLISPEEGEKGERSGHSFGFGGIENG